MTPPELIFLDSATTADAAAAQERGYVSGVTTNPTLLRAAGGEPLRQLATLLEVFRAGPVLYQLHALSGPAARREADAACALAPDRVVLKLPARGDLYTLAADLRRDGVRCAMTAVYSPAQAVLAAQVGAAWVIPYVDRARRLLTDGDGLVAGLARVLDAVRADTRILAASVKSPDQAVRALVDGAHAVTAPLAVIDALGDHGLTDQAVTEFSAPPQEEGAG